MALQNCALNLNRTGRELQPHGTPDFPCAGYSSVYTDSAGDVVPWHWHEDLEIIYVESGHLRLQVPGKTFHLKQGEGAVINSNILHFAAAEPLCELHSLVFHPLLVTGEKDSVFSRRYVAPLLQCRSFDICPFDYLTEDLRAGNPAAVFTAAFDAFCGEPLGYEFVVNEKLPDDIRAALLVCLRNITFCFHMRICINTVSSGTCRNQIRKFLLYGGNVVFYRSRSNIKQSGKLCGRNRLFLLSYYMDKLLMFLFHTHTSLFTVIIMQEVNKAKRIFFTTGMKI